VDELQKFFEMCAAQPTPIIFSEFLKDVIDAYSSLSTKI